jgi:hypothetical protein
MKKSYAILIALLLVLPMLAAAAPVRASGGTVQLGVDNSGAITIANYNVTVMAGAGAGQNDVSGATGNFTIVFDNVTFSGTQFNVYISQNGFASIYPADELYAATFNVADLSQPLHQVNITMGSSNIMITDPTTYYIGTVNGHKVLEGPIPYWITPAYKFIKIFDGSTGAVAASVQTLNILPAISLSPTSGPAGTTVTLTGVALAPNTLYNITYDNGTTAAAQVTTNANGTFTFNWPIEDLCTDWEVIPGDYVAIPIDLWNNGTATFVAEVTYNEYARVILSLTSPIDSQTGPWGNLTGEVDVNVLSPLRIEGNWFNPTSAVNVKIGGTTVGTFTTNATGYFIGNITIPILPLGDNNVTLSNGGCNLIFDAYVEPTLIVTPNTGPIGTNVTFTAYGFKADIPVYLYWFSLNLCNFSEGYNWFANATIGGNGQFNVTVSWTIPQYVGGDMYIVASNTYFGNFSEYSPDDYPYYIASTNFMVTPTLVVTPSSLAADGSLFTVTGTGLIPYQAYTIDIDNQAFAMPNYYSYTYAQTFWGYEPAAGVVQYADSVVWSDDCGNVVIQLVAAGFRPGTHVVALYTSDPTSQYAYLFWNDNSYTYQYGGYGFGNYSLNTYALFSVTAANDTEVNAITTAINSTLNAKLVSIQGDIATLNTTVGTIQGVVTSISGNTATILTDLGTVTASLGTLQTTANSIKGYLPVDLTPIWIAVILSLIAAIAAIYGVIVIRSKIAA